MNESVAIDAKRILLRYGAPISIMDDIGDEDRIRFARHIAKTPLPEREKELRRLLKEEGFLE